MNHMFLKFIEALSKYDIDIKNNYEIIRRTQEKIPFSKFYKSNEVIEENILFRVFSPKNPTNKVVVYIHGGGWTTGTTRNYGLILKKLATELNRNVIAIEYPLAPEHPFPEGFNTCYRGVKIIYETAKKYRIRMDDAVIMGDSAGANLATCICLKAKRTKDFKINKQILIYPIVQTNFKNNKRYASIEANGYKYFLTKKMISDYLELYLVNKSDYKNKYVAPLYARSLFGMPSALIITADLDPLRDEGYAYAKKLKKFFVKVDYHNIKGAIHGYFNNPLYFKEVNKTIKYIKKFVGDKNDKN